MSQDFIISKRPLRCTKHKSETNACMQQLIKRTRKCPEKDGCWYTFHFHLFFLTIYHPTISMGTQTAPYNHTNAFATNDNTRYQQRPLPPAPPLKTSNDMFKVARKPLPHPDQPALRSSRPVSFTPASTTSTPPSSYSSSSSSSTIVNERRQSALGLRRSHNMLSDTDDNDSVYYNNYAVHLESDKESSTSKKFWSKPRTNEKWKELNQKCK